MKTQPINAQTPGPIAPGQNLPVTASLAPCFNLRGEPNPFLEERCKDEDANARLLRAGFNAFDKAGRELGIDAATLAERIDLAEVIRYALDYATLHTAKDGDCGRLDQVKQALAFMRGQVPELLEGR